MEIRDFYNAKKETRAYFEKIFGKKIFKVLKYLGFLVIISDILLLVLYWKDVEIRRTLLGIHLPFAFLLIINMIDDWIFKQEDN